MAKVRRVLGKRDIEQVVGIIKRFRKKPTWASIVSKAQAQGVPFKLRTIQRQPRIKSAYDAKIAEIKARREAATTPPEKSIFPTSEANLRELLAEYEARISDLTCEIAQLAEQLHWMRQRCRRENRPVTDINRPLAFSKDHQVK